MIKFIKAIHLTTGFVLNYKDWEHLIKENRIISFNARVAIGEDSKKYTYLAKDILLSDDFKFIYESNNNLTEIEMKYVIQCINGNENASDFWNYSNSVIKKLHDELYKKY